jgi:hypothetical protein
MELVRAAGARLGNGRACWTIDRLAPGDRRAFSLVATVGPLDALRLERNVGTVTGQNVASVQASARLRMVPLPRPAPERAPPSIVG